jgi:hypothetical protein
MEKRIRRKGVEHKTGRGLVVLGLNLASKVVTETHGLHDLVDPAEVNAVISVK